MIEKITKYKGYILGVIGILIALTMFVGVKYLMKPKYEELPEVKLKEIKDSKSFAIMVQNGDGYEEYKSEDNKWPGTDYVFKEAKCTDNNGTLVENAITFENDKAILETEKTIYCTLYFNIRSDGSVDYPYRIYYIEDLVDLSKNVNDGENFAGKYFKLERDLDFDSKESYKDSESKAYEDLNGDTNVETIIKELTNKDSGKGFTPIGNNIVQFSGTINGNNKTINNLYIKNSALNYVGLFGGLYNASINDLTLNGSISSTIPSTIGALVGISDNTNINNCHNQVNITNIGLYEQNYNTGGLIGEVLTTSNEEMTIINSSNEGNISGGNTIGGIVGFISENSFVKIDKSKNLGTINNNEGRNVGGLVGLNGTTSNLEVINSHNEGVVNTKIGSRTCGGGIVGRTLGNIYIEKSYNTGNVTNLQTDYSDEKGFYTFLGGLIGESAGKNSIIIKSSYNTANISKGDDVGGIMGYNSVGKVIIDRCYNIGNINGVEIGGSWDSFAGGLAGYSRNGEIYILNSYNSYVNNKETEGTVKSEGYYTGGLVGMLTFSGENSQKSIILNSYNLGKITSVKSYAGLIGLAKDNIILNNIYNAGEIQGNNIDYTYGIIYLTNITKKDIRNSYYNNKYNGSNEDDGEGLSIESMQNNQFVNRLNSTVNELNASGLVSIDENLNDYTLCKWKLGSNNYPTLNC